MTMRTDAITACLHGTGDDGKPNCTTTIKVTKEHFAEAQKAVGTDKIMQQKYLRNEAIAGCKLGCPCAKNVIGVFDEGLYEVRAACAESAPDDMMRQHSVNAKI
ncbi:MAG: hypothetical protein ABI678_14900 [Kofleriaceae bacterium]